MFAFVELFAGSERVTAALMEKGLRTLPAFELLDCSAYDLSSSTVQVLIVSWLFSGRLWFVHLAPPCKYFSVAESGAAVSDASKSFVLFSCVAMHVCLLLWIGFSFENQRGSAMWQDPLLHKYITFLSVHRIDMD